ncbi:spherulation-specific family 4 protein [Streptacidiphilus sp. EB129]|uniref:spherulation-specific family 4 protein n=1 Tax=Streptacidiphilus sp. EB129 TaxID=3156262 RepID=UPI0035180DB8
MSGDPLRTAGALLVPAYMHPGAEPGPWRALPASAASLAGVILNPASGPDLRPRPEFQEVAAALRDARVPVLGYVDTAYGRRGHHEVTREVAAHREWYQVDGVFFDQVSADADLLAHYRRLAIAARSLDALRIVLNPGTHPDDGYAGIADLVITFEGDWASYRSAAAPPSWVAAHPPERFGHLVHGCPAAHCAEVAALAAERHAAVSYATPGSGGNPWGELMPQLLGAAPEVIG